MYIVYNKLEESALYDDSIESFRPSIRYSKVFYK